MNIENYVTYFKKKKYVFFFFTAKNVYVAAEEKSKIAYGILHISFGGVSSGDCFNAN